MSLALKNDHPQPALENTLITVKLSTATWLQVVAILGGMKPPEAARQNTVFARECIMRAILHDQSYTTDQPPWD